MAFEHKMIKLNRKSRKAELIPYRTVTEPIVPLVLLVQKLIKENQNGHQKEQ